MAVQGEGGSAPRDGGGIRRRRWLLGAVAATAAAAGAAVAWWRLEPRAPDTRQFWQQRFATIDGDEVLLEHFRGQPLVVNFWASWCPPCVEEMPLLSRFHEAHAADGWQVLGLAVDREEPVRRFLDETPVSFTIAMAGLAGVELTQQLGNSAGGLPFTVVFAADGTLVHRKIGQLGQRDLDGWVG